MLTCSTLLLTFNHILHINSATGCAVALICPFQQHGAHQSFMAGARRVETWLPYLNSRVTDISWHLGLLAAPHRIILYISEADWPLANSPAIPVRQLYCKLLEFGSQCGHAGLVSPLGEVEKRTIRWTVGRVPLRPPTCLIAPVPHRTEDGFLLLLPFIIKPLFTQSNN